MSLLLLLANSQQAPEEFSYDTWGASWSPAGSDAWGGSWGPAVRVPFVIETDWKPVSCRALIPEVDAALAINGRILEYFHTCYDTAVVINGVEVPFSYYFTTSTETMQLDGLAIPNPWDPPWDEGFPRQACSQGYKYHRTDGANPCPSGFGAAMPGPMPAVIVPPEIALDSGLVPSVLAADGDEEIWWY